MELLMTYAKGKYAKFISDRSGLEFPYTEMVKEWNGSLVHYSEFELKHPQLNPKKKSADAEALKDASPQVKLYGSDQLMELLILYIKHWVLKHQIKE